LCRVAAEVAGAHGEAARIPQRAAIQLPIGVEVIDHRAKPAGRHERIEDAVIEKQSCAAAGLVAIVLADDPGLCHRVVRRTDTRQQHQVHVVDSIGTQDHKARRLLVLLTRAHMGVGDASGTFAGGIGQHPGDPGVGAQSEVRALQRQWNDCDVRTALGVEGAAEEATEAAILAGAELRPIGIGVGLGGVRRRTRERRIPKVLRGLREQLARQPRFEWRQRVLALARRLEWIAARPDAALQIAGLARNARNIFELVVIELQLSNGYTHKSLKRATDDPLKKGREYGEVRWISPEVHV